MTRAPIVAPMVIKISAIGFGEAAQAFALDWRGAGVEVRAYDILSDDPARREAKLDEYRRGDIVGCETLRECLADAALVVSLVTADQALAAARAAAQWIGKDAFYVDANSVAPATKQAAAAEIERNGARYIDAAIMAPVEPSRTKVSLLISGPAAVEARDRLAELGFEAEVAGARIGQAATVKMLRSIIVKGSEALSAECFLAAQDAGVAEQVATSLGGDWLAKADYNLDRMMVHGVRRSAEMREVAASLRSLGVSSEMTEATARWQLKIGELGITPEKGLSRKAAQVAGRLKRSAA